MRTSRCFGSCLALGLALTFAQPASAEDKPLGVRLVDQFNAMFGVQKGFRVNHAKGAVFEGIFVPSAGATELSAASFLKGGPTPLTIRFSNSGGFPDVSDAHPTTRGVRGMAIKFRLAEGGEVDMVCVSPNGFPVTNGEDFLAQLKAVAATKPDTPHPTPFETFLSSHPTAKAYLKLPRPMPVSYGTLPYHGINAFKFVNAGGAAKFGRYRVVPEAGAAYVSDEVARRREPNVLGDTLRAAVAKAPVKFKLLVQLAAPGDPTNDPTKVWPDERPTVELGEIAITKPLDTKSIERMLLFLPTNLTAGIEASDDPIINTRTEAYAESFGRRAQ